MRTGTKQKDLPIAEPAWPIRGLATQVSAPDRTEGHGGPIGREVAGRLKPGLY